jgi:hypothetical protein
VNATTAQILPYARERLLKVKERGISDSETEP